MAFRPVLALEQLSDVNLSGAVAGDALILGGGSLWIPGPATPHTKVWDCGALFGTLPDPPGSQSNTEPFDLDDGVVAIFDAAIESFLVTPTAASQVYFTVGLTLTDGVTTWLPVPDGAAPAGTPKPIGAFQANGGPPFDEHYIESKCAFVFYPGRGNAGDPPAGLLTATLTMAVVSGTGSGLVQIGGVTVELRQGVL